MGNFVSPNTFGRAILTALIIAISTISPIASAEDGTQDADAFDQGMVTLTFDSNWDSQDVALPALADAGISATFCIVTDDIVGDNSGNIAKIQEIADAGHEICAHSRTHPSLVSLDPDKMEEEIAWARQDLLDAGFDTVDTYAYPFGDYDDAVIAQTEAAWYVGARWVDDGYNTPSTDRYALKVQNVLDTTTEQEMESWIKTAMQQKTWLILVFHDVNYKHDPYGTTPEIFRSFVNYLSDNDIPTATMKEGLDMMN